MYEPLSDEFIDAWRAEVLEATRGEKGGDPWSLLLRFRADGSPFLQGDRAVFVSLAGERVVDLLGERRAENPDFVISAGASRWKEIFDGKRDPVTAILFGDLIVEKGSAGQLAPHVTAARKLLEAATRVPVRLPEARV